MSRTQGPLSPHDVLRALSSSWRTWLATAAAGGALALVYVLLMTRYWEASQGLVVRQEAAGTAGARPGKFSDLYEMRTFQETLLEVAKSNHVLQATLREVDGTSGGAAAVADAQQIEKLRRRVSMTPPGGAEFGKTEVFYLTAKDANRERAVQLVTVLCEQIDARLRDLRQERASGMLAELAEHEGVAARRLAVETRRLSEFESNVGSDLGELRMLHSAFSGQSDLRQQQVALERDVRIYEMRIGDAQQLILQLRAAQNEPRQLIATPSSLLTSQPALNRLREGLVDAQLTTARLRGTRSDEHPLVLAAFESEARIRKDLFRELESAIESAEAELQLDLNRRDEAAARLASVQQRLSRLAELRAEYSNRVAAMESTRRLLEEARKKQSEAVAAQFAAQTASLVARIDQPETGPHPAGPGRASIVLLGLASGLGLGLSWVFLTTGPSGVDRSAEEGSGLATNLGRGGARNGAPHRAAEQRKVAAQRDADATTAQVVLSSIQPSATSAPNGATLNGVH